MSKTARRSVLLVVTLFLLLPAAASAETKKESGASSPVSKTAQASKAPTLLPLPSTTLVNANQIAQEVAQKASIKAETENRGDVRTSDKTQPKQEADGAVMEFHSINSAPLIDSPAGTFHPKERKKSVLKDFHGSIYGARASGIGQANAVGGDAGAESKSGKFSIYVEGAHSHASSPTAH